MSSSVLRLIQSVLKGVFPGPSVDSIVSGFQRNIDALTRLEARQKAEAEHQSQIADEANLLAAQATAEALRAKAVAAKISHLIGAA